MVLLDKRFRLAQLWLATKSISREFRGMRVGRLMGAERRAAPRVKCYDLVKWIRKGDSMCHQIANLHDISVGGLRFSSREQLPLNTELSMILNIAEENREVPVLAKVVWSRPTGLDAYESGVSFIDIRDEDRSVIGRLIPFAEKIVS